MEKALKFFSVSIFPPRSCFQAHIIELGVSTQFYAVMTYSLSARKDVTLFKAGKYHQFRLFLYPNTLKTCSVSYTHISALHPCFHPKLGHDSVRISCQALWEHSWPGGKNDMYRVEGTVPWPASETCFAVLAEPLYVSNTPLTLHPSYHYKQHFSWFSITLWCKQLYRLVKFIDIMRVISHFTKACFFWMHLQVPFIVYIYTQHLHHVWLENPRYVSARSFFFLLRLRFWTKNNYITLITFSQILWNSEILCKTFSPHQHQIKGILEHEVVHIYLLSPSRCEDYKPHKQSRKKYNLYSTDPFFPTHH